MKASFSPIKTMGCIYFPVVEVLAGDFPKSDSALVIYQNGKKVKAFYSAFLECLYERPFSYSRPEIRMAYEECQFEPGKEPIL